MLQNNTSFYWGPYKRTQSEALQQAKFYLPRQAAVPQQALLCHSSTQATVDKGVLCTVARLLRQLYILHEPQGEKSLCVLGRFVRCGASTVAIDALQFESFYTVPFYWSILFRSMIIKLVGLKVASFYPPPPPLSSTTQTAKQDV